MNMSNKMAFVEYKDTDERGDVKIVAGFFEIISESPRLKIRSGKNIITLPEHAWHKIKHKVDAQ